MKRCVHRIAGGVLGLLLTCSVAGAAPSDFYLNNLRRGIAEYDGGRYAGAAQQLRIAAFGLMDSIDHYQTAKIYHALASDKLGDEATARDDAQRVIAAQRIDPKYGRLELPTGVRSAFDALAKRLLTASEVAALRPSAESPAPVQRPPVQTATQPQKPRETVPAPATQTKPTPIASSQPPKPAGTGGTNSTNNISASKPEPKPAPAQKPPAPRPAQTPAATTTAPAKPRTETVTPPRDPAPRPSTNTTPARDIASRLAAGEAALGKAQLISARSIYRDLLAAGGLQRSDLLRVAEGLYRARDFVPALRAFRQLEPLQRSEEPYRYYIAVSLYETGQHAAAKKELAAALPHIEVTEDVARYRTRINAAID